MRLFLVLIPVALIGGFAIHQVASDSSATTEALTIAVEAPAIPDIPAKAATPAIAAAAAVPAMPAVDVRVAPLAEVSVRVPRQAMLEAEVLANEIRLRAEAAAHADIEATLEGVIRKLDESLSETDIALEEAFEELGISASFLADLAASIEASLEIAVEEGAAVRVRLPQKRRQ